MNQLVNHLDKIRRLSDGDFRPRVIIRTSVGAKRPIDSGLQHTQTLPQFLKKFLKKLS